jgi:RHS repeat-associated protein
MKILTGGDPGTYEKARSTPVPRPRRWLAGACLLLAMSGCSQRQSKDEPLKKLRLRLQTPVAAFGFDEGSGNTVTDSSGNGLNTTLSGQTRVTGKYGGALDFNETFLTIADSSLLDLTTGMTLSAWVQPSEIEMWWSSAIYKEGEEDAIYALMASGPSPGGPVAVVSSEQDLALASVEDPEEDRRLPVGVWSHIAATYDATTLRLWINGAQAASTPFSGPIAVSSGALRIGGTELFDEFFIGRIDEVRVYDRALSQAEIATDMQTPIAGGGGGCGSGCSDGNVCNGTETCVSNSCVPGTPLTVDDQNPCTTDACDPVTGVSHTAVANGTGCTDADLCTQTSACQSGTCVGSNPVTCTALDQCHDAGTCNPATGTCSNPNKPNGTSCSDANACTASDSCQSGSCAPGAAVPTDDGNPCTTDGCDPGSGVTHAPVAAGTPCLDGDVCNGAEACNAIGLCTAGTPLVTDDGNACTTDGCHPTNGVTHTPVAAGTACPDGTVCIGAEACVASGVCQAGTPLVTNDGNPCTADACDPVAGVSHTPVAAGTACPDGNACNGDELCNASALCNAGTPIPTDDGNACTNDACDPATGAVTHPPAPAGTACTLDACTMASLCDGNGTCTGGAPIPIDDGIDCTLDTCDAVSGIQHRPCADIDRTVATSVNKQLEWLYTGSNPIQTGVAPGTVEARRAAGLHGTVKDVAGNPLPNVAISVVAHPELGETITRADGAFDIVVNGGGQLSLTLEKDGYLEVQRTQHVPWSDTVAVDPVVMIKHDPAVTTVDLTQTTEPLQVARGSIIGDEDGIRQGTLLLPAGTEATMHLPDGTTEPLDTMNVRITEFTVGPTGPAAMPAALPPTSQYTYAFEVNADEAVQLGVETTTFSQPLTYYVENFVGFPVGTTVPVGSYNRKKAQWIPETSGVVIGIVNESGGLAGIDVTGDGVADSAAQLTAHGITEAERSKLAELYAPGATLWRVPITHFTYPFDLNWPGIPPDDAEPPPPPRDPDPPLPDDVCTQPGGSTIECQTQILRESVPIAGTPFRLTYASDRAPGRLESLMKSVLLSGPTVPPSLERIDLQITVAGRTFKQSFPASPNQSVIFNWDGKDRFGRVLQGAQYAKVKVSYIYPAIYGLSCCFGMGGVESVDAFRVPSRYFFNQYFDIVVGGWDSRPTGLGGWAISEHHAYDAQSRTLLLGDGTRRSNKAAKPQVVELIKATPSGSELSFQQLTVAPDGSVYVIDQFAQRHRIRKVDTQGLMTTIAGTGVAGYSGDGGPAIAAMLNQPWGLALANDGGLYIADLNNQRIRRVDANGTITTVAGTGVRSFGGEGGPATSAHVGDPWDVAVGPDGSLYIAQGVGLPPGGSASPGLVVRRVGTDGIIRKVAGNGSRLGAREHGIPATHTPLALGSHPAGIAVSEGGDIFIVDAGEEDGNLSYLVRRVDRTGIIHLVAGCPGCGQLASGPATSVGLGAISDIAVAPNGTVYIEETYTPLLGMSSQVIRQIGVDGVIRLIAGGVFNAVPVTNGQIAGRVELGRTHIALGPAGLYMTDDAGLLRLKPSLPGLAATQFPIASEDGERLHIFDLDGRHARTTSALTNATLQTFGYDGAGRLATITDGDGNVTSIAHDTEGNPTSITAPFGQVTTLDTDENGFISSITNPLGDSVTTTYSPSGLMLSYRDERLFTATMTYDPFGRLATDRDGANALKTLTNNDTPQNWLTTLTTGEGRVTEFALERLSSGELRRTNTFPDGTRALDLTQIDGTRVLTLPDGTIARNIFSSDPRWSQDAPTTSVTTTLPSGLVRNETQSRVVTLSNPNNPLTLTTLENQYRVNNRLTRTLYTVSNRTFTTTSPAGRSTSTTIDLQGRPTQFSVPTVTPVVLAYDTRGRLSTITQGSRVQSTTYDATSGYIASTINALNQTTVTSRDPLGRVLVENLPDTNSVGYGWDAAGNLTNVTPPGRPAHLQSYTPVNLLQSYAPPAVPGVSDPATMFTHDLDRKARVTTRPDALSFERFYDSAGKIDFINTPTGSYDYQYFGLTTCPGCAPGKLSRITSPTGVHLDLTYDGQLVKSTTWSGPVSGALSFTRDTDFRVATETVTAGTTNSVIRYGYDADSLLICASPTSCSPGGSDALQVTFASNVARIDRSDLGATREARTYNSFGELASLTSTHGSSTLYSEVMHTIAAPRDALGRIVTRVETSAGVTATWGYVYDLRGRLQEVFKNGASVEQFVYDPNSNRTSRITPAETWAGVYDDQDRLLSYGPYTYTYTANGELRTKTIGGQTTTYTYDVGGNLVRVDLPGGTVIEYLIDGQDRRVGKKRNGVLEKQWLYKDQLRIAAELDGAGNLVSRFVYASRENVPDFVIRGAATYRVFSDHLGSPRVVANVANVSDVPVSLEYAAFGAVSGTGSAWMPQGFAGGLHDVDTGLVRFGARDYDSQTGRWTSKDPRRFDSGSTNFYAYAESDPVNKMDSDGEAAFVIPIAVAVAEGYAMVQTASATAGWIRCAQKGRECQGKARDVPDDGGSCDPNKEPGYRDRPDSPERRREQQIRQNQDRCRQCVDQCLANVISWKHRLMPWLDPWPSGCP